MVDTPADLEACLNRVNGFLRDLDARLGKVQQSQERSSQAPPRSATSKNTLTLVDITPESLEQLAYVTSVGRTIDNLWYAHGSHGYDGVMRKEGGPNPKFKYTLDDSLPRQAGLTLQNFIEPLLANLLPLNSTSRGIEGFLSWVFDQQIDETFRFAVSYAKLLVQHMQLDEKDPSYLQEAQAIHAECKALKDPMYGKSFYNLIVIPDTKKRLIEYAKGRVMDDADIEVEHPVYDALFILDINDNSRAYQRAWFRKETGEYRTQSIFLKYAAEHPEVLAQKEGLIDLAAWLREPEPTTKGSSDHKLYPLPVDHQVWKDADGSWEVFDVDPKAGTYLQVIVKSGLANVGAVFGPITEWPPHRSDLIAGPGAPCSHSYGSSDIVNISQLPLDNTSGLTMVNGCPFGSVSK